jgi:hypothetical protein
LLDIIDPRTVRRLLRRGGLLSAESAVVLRSPLLFITTQKFVTDTAALAAIERQLHERRLIRASGSK